MNTHIESAHTLASRLDSTARAVLVAVVFLLPIAILPASWLALPMTKMSVLAFGVLTALLLWAVARFTEHRLQFPMSHVLGTVLLLVAGYIVSALLSSSLLQSLIGFGFERDTALAMFVLGAALMAFALTTQKVAHVIRLQKAALAAFLIIGLFQIVRMTVGADTVLPTLFSNDPTATVLGGWNDLAVFSGLVVITVLSGLALFSARLVRAGLYITLAIALFLLVVVNLAAVWITLAIAVLMLMIYIFSDASYDPADGSFRVHIPWQRLLPSAFVILLSILFLASGATLGQRISQTFNVSYVDVRPSWEGTMNIGSGTLKENLLFGAGPNAFERAWVDHKPVSINETDFWNIDFSFGIGLVPTAFITGGVLVGAFWLLFFGAFLYLGSRMLGKRSTAPAHMYLIASSLFGAGYLWILTIVYVPQLVMLAYAFMLTGVMVAVAVAAGVLNVREIRAQHSYASGLVLTGTLVLLIVVGIGAVVVQAERLRTNIVLSRVVAIANAGDLERASALADTASILGSDARAAQLKTNIEFARFSALLNQENENTTELQAQLEAALSRTVAAAQSAVAANENDYQNWLLLGDVYASLVPLEIEGAVESAAAAYEQAQQRNAKTPLVAMRLARLAFATNDLESARTYASAALNLKSNYTDAYYLLSQIAINQNNVADAIASTESAVLLNPENTGLLFQLGVLQYNAAAYDRAVTILERAVTINPDYANALYFLGLSYEQLGNAEATLAAFERIAALNPDNEQIVAVVATLKEGGTAVEVLEQQAAATSGETGELPLSEER